MSDFFKQFFDWADFRDSFPLIWRGFTINIQIFVRAMQRAFGRWPAVGITDNAVHRNVTALSTHFR